MYDVASGYAEARRQKDLLDAIEKAADKLGLTNEINREAIIQTFIGSLKLLKISKKKSIDLVENIAVKGGTTEAGISVMKKNNIHRIFEKSILSAYKKSKLLSK